MSRNEKLFYKQNFVIVTKHGPLFLVKVFPSSFDVKELKNCRKEK